MIGVDLGLQDFAVLSEGGRVPVAQFFRKTERKLSKAQRVFSRRKKGNRRQRRANRRIALLHRKTGKQRQDFLHKPTTELVEKYAGLCIEDFNVAALAKNQAERAQQVDPYDSEGVQYLQELQAR